MKVDEEAKNFFANRRSVSAKRLKGPGPGLKEIQEIKKGSELPTIIGSGLTAENAKEILSVADGAIVGVSLKENNNVWNSRNS